MSKNLAASATPAQNHLLAACLLRITSAATDLERFRCARHGGLRVRRQTRLRVFPRLHRVAPLRHESERRRKSRSWAMKAGRRRAVMGGNPRQRRCAKRRYAYRLPSKISKGIRASAVATSAAALYAGADHTDGADAVATGIIRWSSNWPAGCC